MQPMIHVFLCDKNNERFFGEGPRRLLQAVEETGSLRAAAQCMGMAYTKALKLIRHAENNLGYPLTERKTGGSGGGGSQLTPQAKELMEQYEIYRTKCMEANRRIFEECFLQQPETSSASHRSQGERQDHTASEFSEAGISGPLP